MQKIKLKTEESGKKLLEAYAPPKWSETADETKTTLVLLLINITVSSLFMKGYLKFEIQQK